MFLIDSCNENEIKWMENGWERIDVRNYMLYVALYNNWEDICDVRWGDEMTDIFFKSKKEDNSNNNICRSRYGWKERGIQKRWKISMFINVWSMYVKLNNKKEVIKVENVKDYF